MVKTDTTMLALIAVGGFLLYKSDILKGAADVSSGVGDAARGLGSGVGFAGQSLGYNLSDIFNAFGQAGQSTQTLIRESERVITDTSQTINEDLQPTLDAAGDIFVDTANIGSDASGALRNVNSGFWNAFETTWNLDNPDNIFSTTARGIANNNLITQAKNAGSSVFNWVKSQVSSEDKSLKPSITGAAVAPTPTSSSNSSASSSSSSSAQPSGSNSFLESLGYTGQSTASGVVYTAPTTAKIGSIVVPISKPAPAPAPKPSTWWNPFD